MERPSVVEVSGIYYKVHYDHTQLPQRKPSIAQKARGELNPSASGTIDHDPQKIVIDDRMGEDYVAETLLHEILHALFYIVDAGLPSKTEERIVRTVSPVLLATLRHNPKFVELLLGRP